MTDKPKVGANVYNALIQRGRSKTQTGREALRKMAEDDPGPQTRSILIARMAIVLGDIEAVLSELHQIGRDARAKIKDE